MHIEKLGDRETLKWTSWFISALFHLIGSTLVFILMISLSIGGETALHLTRLILSEEIIKEAVTFRVAIHFGLAASLWAIGFIIYKLGELRLRERKTPRLIRRPAGTVITETLITLPVLLLLILGMIQLSLNNVAGILIRVAEFQAARTAWVWVPEMQEGVTEEEVIDRIRISIALVMTPTAPQTNADLSERAEFTQEFMTDRFDTGPSFSWPPWGQGAPKVRVSNALDSSASLSDRATKKFAGAYGNTAVTELITGEEVGADFTFYHFQGVPLVGRYFGEPDGITAYTGTGNRYFQPYTVEARMPAQIYGTGRL